MSHRKIVKRGYVLSWVIVALWGIFGMGRAIRGEVACDKISVVDSTGGNFTILYQEMFSDKERDKDTRLAAALLLQEYIEKSTGRKLSMVRIDADDGFAYDEKGEKVQLTRTPKGNDLTNYIFVGDSDLLAELDSPIDLSDVDGEEYVICSMSSDNSEGETVQNIVLMGNDDIPLGSPFSFNSCSGNFKTPTIYAVSKFLEKTIGAGWYFPGELGEVYDSTDSYLCVEEMALKQEPASQIRSFQLRYLDVPFEEYTEYGFDRCLDENLNIVDCKNDGSDTTVGDYLRRRNTEWFRLNHVGMYRKLIHNHYWYRIMPKERYVEEVTVDDKDEPIAYKLRDEFKGYFADDALPPYEDGKPMVCGYKSRLGNQLCVSYGVGEFESIQELLLKTCNFSWWNNPCYGGSEGYNCCCKNLYCCENHNLYSRDCICGGTPDDTPTTNSVTPEDCYRVQEGCSNDNIYCEFFKNLRPIMDGLISGCGAYSVAIAANDGLGTHCMCDLCRPAREGARGDLMFGNPDEFNRTKKIKYKGFFNVIASMTKELASSTEWADEKYDDVLLTTYSYDDFLLPDYLKNNFDLPDIHGNAGYLEPNLLLFDVYNFYLFSNQDNCELEQNQADANADRMRYWGSTTINADGTPAEGDQRGKLAIYSQVFGMIYFEPYLANVPLSGWKQIADLVGRLKLNGYMGGYFDMGNLVSWHDMYLLLRLLEEQQPPPSDPTLVDRDVYLKKVTVRALNIRRHYYKRLYDDAWKEVMEFHELIEGGITQFVHRETGGYDPDGLPDTDDQRDYSTAIKNWGHWMLFDGVFKGIVEAAEKKLNAAEAKLQNSDKPLKRLRLLRYNWNFLLNLIDYSDRLSAYKQLHHEGVVYKDAGLNTFADILKLRYEREKMTAKYNDINDLDSVMLALSHDAIRREDDDKRQGIYVKNPEAEANKGDKVNVRTARMISTTTCGMQGTGGVRLPGELGLPAAPLNKEALRRNNSCITVKDSDGNKVDTNVIWGDFFSRPHSYELEEGEQGERETYANYILLWNDTESTFAGATIEIANIDYSLPYRKRPLSIEYPKRLLRKNIIATLPQEIETQKISFQDDTEPADFDIESEVGTAVFTMDVPPGLTVLKFRDTTNIAPYAIDLGFLDCENGKTQTNCLAECLKAGICTEKKQGDTVIYTIPSSCDPSIFKMIRLYPTDDDTMRYLLSKKGVNPEDDIYLAGRILISRSCDCERKSGNVFMYTAEVIHDDGTYPPILEMVDPIQNIICKNADDTLMPCTYTVKGAVYDSNDIKRLSPKTLIFKVVEPGTDF